MLELSPEQTLVLWNNGHFLSRCYRAFASPSQRKRQEESDQVSAMKILSDEMKKPERKNEDWSTAFFNSMTKPQQILQERTELSKSIEAVVLSHLKSGQLIGCGFEPPRMKRSFPVVLDPSHWFEFVGWSDCKVRIQSLNFVDIRVLTSRGALQLLDIANPIASKVLPDPPSKRPVGRPTVRTDIDDCFDALNSLGKIDVNCDVPSHIPMVRQWLTEHRPLMKPSALKVKDQTLKLHFSNKFNTLRIELNLDK